MLYPLIQSQPNPFLSQSQSSHSAGKRYRDRFWVLERSVPLEVSGGVIAPPRTALSDGGSAGTGLNGT